MGISAIPQPFKWGLTTIGDEENLPSGVSQLMQTMWEGRVEGEGPAVSYRGTKKFRFGKCLLYIFSFPLLITYKNLRDSRIIKCGLLKVSETSEIDTNALFSKLI